MYPIILARGTELVYMFIKFHEKEKQFRGYRDSDKCYAEHL
jgi:hypothetical protein